VGPRLPPRYLRVARPIEALGHPPVLALTATAAPPGARRDLDVLGMRDPEVIVRGFDRPNIRLEVVRHEEAHHKRRALLDRVEERKAGPGSSTAPRRRAPRRSRRSCASAACAPSTTTAD
jgi:ATP-dependent DNA helicase RecQ